MRKYPKLTETEKEQRKIESIKRVQSEIKSACVIHDVFTGVEDIDYGHRRSRRLNRSLRLCDAAAYVWILNNGLLPTLKLNNLMREYATRARKAQAARKRLRLD